MSESPETRIDGERLTETTCILCKEVKSVAGAMSDMFSVMHVNYAAYKMTIKP